MTTRNRCAHNRRGNVLLYVLLGVALMAALIFAINSDMRGQQTNRITQEQIELLGTALMAHVTTMEQSVFQMTQFGADYPDLLFDLPGSPNYTNNTRRQIFHPSGGGVTPFSTNDDLLFDPGNSSKRGWVLQNQTNVEWSPSTNIDLIYSFLDINPQLCAHLNKKITGSENIPQVTFDFKDVFTMDGNNNSLTETLCPACKNRRILCIKNNNAHALYSIIGSH